MSAVLIGDKERFAVGLTWYPCDGPSDPGVGATWCELVIWLAGHAATRHVASGMEYEGVVVPAAPIADWVGRNWAALAGEERLVGGGRFTSYHGLTRARFGREVADEDEDAIDAFVDGHCLVGVRGGLLLPHVVFWRRGAVFSVSWQAAAEGSGERTVLFVSSGEATVPSAEIFDVLRRFVSVVSDRVQNAADHSMSRHEVVQAQSRVNGSQPDIDLLAARLGTNVDALRRRLSSLEQRMSQKDALVELYGPEIRESVRPEDLDSPLAAAARSASPSFSENDHHKLFALGDIVRRRSRASGLEKLREDCHVEADSTAATAFDVGYRRAERVRHKLRKVSGRLDIAGLLADLGCAVEDTELDDWQTDGIALWTREGQALVAPNPASPRTQSTWGRRAMLAHELFHLLYDASSTRFFGEGTSDWTASPTEAEANAFAAELLLPAQRVTGLPSSMRVDEWAVAIRSVMQAYETGWELTVRHLVNRKKIPRALEHPLLSSLSPVVRDR